MRSVFKTIFLLVAIVCFTGLSLLSSCTAENKKNDIYTFCLGDSCLKFERLVQKASMRYEMNWDIDSSFINGEYTGSIGGNSYQTYEYVFNDTSHEKHADTQYTCLKPGSWKMRVINDSVFTKNSLLIHYSIDSAIKVNITFIDSVMSINPVTLEEQVDVLMRDTFHVGYNFGMVNKKDLISKLSNELYLNGKDRLYIEEMTIYCYSPNEWFDIHLFQKEGRKVEGLNTLDSIKRGDILNIRYLKIRDSRLSLHEYYLSAVLTVVD